MILKEKLILNTNCCAKPCELYQSEKKVVNIFCRNVVNVEKMRIIFEADKKHGKSEHM